VVWPPKCRLVGWLLFFLLVVFFFVRATFLDSINNLARGSCYGMAVYTTCKKACF